MNVALGIFEGIVNAFAQHESIVAGRLIGGEGNAGSVVAERPVFFPKTEVRSGWAGDTDYLHPYISAGMGVTGSSHVKLPVGKRDEGEGVCWKQSARTIIEH